MQNLDRNDVVAIIDRLGYLKCVRCEPDGLSGPYGPGKIAVQRDAFPACEEPCDVCGKIVKEARQ